MHNNNMKHKNNELSEIKDDIVETHLEGRNSVLEALKSEREIEKILIQKDLNNGSIGKIVTMARKKSIIIQEVVKQKLDALSSTRNHQGVLAFVSVKEYVDINDILNKAYSNEEMPFVIILDEISDPHNLGAILRTADASGAHGVIIPKRRSAGLTPIVSKVSAGAIEYVDVAKVSNISQTIDKLKKEGLWIVSADMSGENYLYNADFNIPLALIIGSEGKGVSRLIKEKSDFLVKIPMEGRITSLNASVACGIMAFEVLRQRKFS